MQTCPKCGQAYEDWVELCTDCRPPVRLGEEAPPPADEGPEESGPGGPPEGSREIRLFTPREAGEIGQILKDEGIEVEATLADYDGDSVFGSTGADARSFALHVPIERFDESLSIIKEYFGLEGDDTTASAEESCPACQGPIEGDMLECPECGLRLAQESTTISPDHPFLAFLATVEGR